MCPVSCITSPASDRVSAHGCIRNIIGYSIPPLASTPSIDVICGYGYGQRYAHICCRPPRENPAPPPPHPPPGPKNRKKLWIPTVPPAPPAPLIMGRVAS